MARKRVLAVALDGYEASLAEAMEAEGALPFLAGLRRRAGWFNLDHGSAERTGLASEHFSTGLSPADAGRWSAVDFDRDTYGISQEPLRRPPFAASLESRTVVFDVGYFDLEGTPKAQGVVAWGAHDPGVDPAARPASLAAEMAERFGPYPAEPWIYGFVWPSVDDTEAMGRDLVKAVDLRARAAEWLLGERLPDWDLGIVMVSESHSATEALWHGVDPTHPLHGHPSAAAAGKGVREVYKAIDRLLERLAGAFPDAELVVFAMHGMGTNDADAASMALLPELLYRHAFGRPFMRDSDRAEDRLEPGETWHGHMVRRTPPTLMSRLRRRLLGKVDNNLEWMPAARYQRFWATMPAFALPSFYDGRIRINLVGREAHGKVALKDYARTCDEIERLLSECTDLRTGRPVLRELERTHRADPFDLGSSEADLVAVWDAAPQGLRHPTLGQVGPVPYRRTGGHTGLHGMALFLGQGYQAGRLGKASSFDVAPTIIDMLGERPNVLLSGVSLKPMLEGDTPSVSARG